MLLQSIARTAHGARPKEMNRIKGVAIPPINIAKDAMVAKMEVTARLMQLRPSPCCGSTDKIASNGIKGVQKTQYLLQDHVFHRHAVPIGLVPSLARWL